MSAWKDVSSLVNLIFLFLLLEWPKGGEINNMHVYLTLFYSHSTGKHPSINNHMHWTEVLEWTTGLTCMAHPEWAVEWKQNGH